MCVWLCHALSKARKDDRYVHLLFVATVTIAIGGYGAAYAINLFTTFSPKYDLYLYAIDRSLGISVSFQLGRVIGPGTVWFPVLECIYQVLYVSMLLVYELHFIRGEKPRQVITAFSLNLLGGLLLYFLLPACGPACTAAGGFPAREPVWNGLHPLNLLGPINAIPSVHTSTALLILWFCKNPGPRVLASLYLFGIILATLASGEHWLIDLVVAVPFAAAVYHVSATQWRSALIWITLTVSWMSALLWASPFVTGSPIVVIVACLLTVVLPWRSIDSSRDFKRRTVSGAKVIGDIHDRGVASDGA